MSVRFHEAGCPKEADPRNETCDCDRIRESVLLRKAGVISAPLEPKQKSDRSYQWEECDG